MTTIATLTMNPALDVTTGTPEVRPTNKLRCTAARHDPGGGGINVARVLHALGGEAIAVFPAGGPAGARVEALLRDAAVPVHAVPIAGDTRESITIDETGSGLQYRFVLPGPELAAAEQARLLDALAALPGPPQWIVASGSLPPGVAPDFYCDVAAAARRLGARLILDTSGAALKASEGAGAFLIKPSRSELEAVTGRPLIGAEDEAAAARELLARGFAQSIVVSLAERGALLVTNEGVEHFPAIEVPIASAVGAGDSMVGAITLALSQGKSVREAVRYGIAAGAAALMTPATELVRRADVERLAAGAS
ncbi:1-phosphofructokinase family hexose kinase [Sphingosinithalassobacter sp. LHW66-3]|uniref:1-phosphofructokinase family hexose kinase n=1 Tax=Sphingosinithalassobacter sp. LHW66-3 TaxID=3424718 RepID=UPI003D6BA2A0